jgi:hypothetical protein
MWQAPGVDDKMLRALVLPAHKSKTGKDEPFRCTFEQLLCHGPVGFFVGEARACLRRRKAMRKHAEDEHGVPQGPVLPSDHKQWMFLENNYYTRNGDPKADPHAGYKGFKGMVGATEDTALAMCEAVSVPSLFWLSVYQCLLAGGFAQHHVPVT